MTKINFQVDESGNVIGHTDYPYAEIQEGGYTLDPPETYVMDDDNWHFVSGKMVKKEIKLPDPIEVKPSDGQEVMTQIMTTLAEHEVETKQVQNALTQTLNAQAQMQIGMTQLMNQMATQTQNGGL